MCFLFKSPPLIWKKIIIYRADWFSWFWERKTIAVAMTTLGPESIHSIWSEVTTYTWQIQWSGFSVKLLFKSCRGQDQGCIQVKTGEKQNDGETDFDTTLMANFNATTRNSPPQLKTETLFWLVIKRLQLWRSPTFLSLRLLKPHFSFRWF